MSVVYDHVNRGDLITIDLMNSILTRLKAVEDRVNQLAAGSQGSTSVLSATLQFRTVIPPEDPKIVAPGNYTYTFPIKAYTTLNETYHLTPEIREQPTWQVVVLNDPENQVEASHITIPASPAPAGIDRTVKVRVSIPDGATGTGQLGLAITSLQDPTIGNASGLTAVTVNAKPVVDDKFTILERTVGGPGVLVGGTVAQAPAPGGAFMITLKIQVKTPGNYTIGTPTIDLPEGWTVKPKDVPPNFTTTTVNETTLIHVSLQATSSQVSAATISIPITGHESGTLTQDIAPKTG